MKNVRADDEAFENDNEAVETKDESQAPFVVTGNGYCEDRTDKRDHASEGWDDLKQAAEDCPERRPRDANQLEPNEPEDSDDERVKSGGAPPGYESAAGCFEVRRGVAVSEIHTNLLVLYRIQPAGTEL